MTTGSRGALVGASAQTSYGTAFSPDRTRAYVSRQGGAFIELDVATGQELRSVVLPAASNSVTISADDATAYVGGAVVNLRSFTVSATLVLDNGPRVLTPGFSALSPDGATLYVTGSWGGTTWQVFAISTTTLQTTAIGGTGTAPQGIAVSSDGRWVLTTHTMTFTQGALRVNDASTLASVRSVSLGVTRCHSGSAMTSGM